MKKILFFIPTLTGGGAEKILLDTVNNLDCNKYEITVQTLYDEGLYINQLSKKIKYKSINSFKNIFFKKIYSQLLFHIISPRIIYNIFIKDDYDIEIAYLEGISTKIIGESTNKKSKKFAWVHIDLFNYYNLNKVYRNIDENTISYRKFDKILCVSNSVLEGFIKRFGDFKNVFVQYNVIDDIEIQKRSLEPVDYDFSNKFKLITIGRLTHQKGYDRLLEVHKKLVNEGLDFELLILGDGEKRLEIEEFININKLHDSVKLLGFRSNPYAFIKRSDLFVCSSRAEGFSTVATEAIILGVPIVTTECAGMKELLGDSEYGLIVKNDTDSLYNGLKLILTNKEKYNFYKEKAQLRGKNFTKKKRIDELDELFNI